MLFLSEDKQGAKRYAIPLADVAIPFLNRSAVISLTTLLIDPLIPIAKKCLVQNFFCASKLHVPRAHAHLYS